MLAGAGANPLIDATKKKPNVVLFFTDEMFKQHLSSFKHPFDLQPIAFMNTDAYKKLAQATRSKGPATFPDWPPKNPPVY